VGRALKKEPLIVYEDGLQTRDFCHINDVVAANMRVLESDDADFKRLTLAVVSRRLFLSTAHLLRKKLSSNVEMTFCGEYRRGDNRHSVSKIDKLKMLGWAPKYDLLDDP